MEEGFVHYKHRIIQEGTILNRNNPGPDNVYFIVFYCLQHILHHSDSIPKMNLLNSYDHMFYIATKCGWKNKTCRRKIFKTQKYKLPYIKLTGSDRKHIKLK